MHGTLRVTFFYFTLKALFGLRFLHFCPDFFGHVGKQFDKELKINLKIYNVPDHNQKLRTFRRMTL